MPLTKDPDNPEWTREDFVASKPAAALPASVLAAFPRSGETSRDAGGRTVTVTLCLSVEVVDYFKAQGPGWEARIDQALKAVIE